MWNAVQGWWSADLLEVSLQATLLAGVVGVLASLLRESDPRLRHGLWLLVVLRLALPLNLQSPVGVLDREVTEGLVPTVVETPRSAPPAALPIDAGEAYRGLPAGGPPEHAAMVGPPLDVRRLGFLLWIFGALAVGAWALGSVLRLRRVVGESSPDRALSERAEELAAQHGVLSAPVLLSERENLGPLLAGLWRPQVVLPKSALDWPAAERDATLLHELAHLSRRDLWAVPLLAIARALHWFNPVVWFAARQVAAERELCCDDWVLRRRDVPKDYTRALLRGGLGTRSEAGVGMAAPRSRLLKRVRRLLSSEYRPPRLRRLATLCAVGVAGWAAFSFASPTEEDRPIETLEHRFAPSERVSGRIGLRGYYLPTPYGELGARRPWSGGRGLRPAERRWADVLPELPSDFSAKYTMDLILDAEGKVASLQTRAADSEDPAATEFVGTLEAGARQLRWRPIVHSVHGPVSADLSVSVEVRPSVEIETLRLAQRRPLGQLMSWLVEDDSGMVGPQAPQESDHFLSLLGEPELPSLVAWDEAFYGDYSMLLQVSPDGSVESSQVQGTPRRALLRREPGRNLQDLRETIEAWGSELRFEQLETETEKVIGAGVSLDLRFDASGIAIITYEAPESGWEEAFYSLYSLPQDQSLLLLPGPPIPERIEYLRTHNPDIVRRHPEGPSVLPLRVVEGVIDTENQGGCYGGCPLFDGDHSWPSAVFSHIRAFVDSSLEFEIEPGLEAIGPGDFLMRADATVEELLDDFVSEYERHTEGSITWERVTRLQPTIVLRGRLGEIAREPELDDRRTLHLYVGEMDPDPRSGSGFARGTNAETLRGVLARVAEMPALDQTYGAEVPGGMTVRTHGSAMNTEQLDELLANIEAQTELEIEVEEMPVEKIRIAGRNE